MSFIRYKKGDPMEPPATLRLTLVHCAADDAAFSPNYQGELRQFYQLVRASGIRMSAVAFTLPDVAGDRGLTGEFVMPLADVISPMLGAAAIAWLQGRAGRRLRLTVGDVEVEARTPAELLQQAQALHASQGETQNEA
jgi:hypothetical protein